MKEISACNERISGGIEGAASEGERFKRVNEGHTLQDECVENGGYVLADTGEDHT
jgi:hypothetical protein